MRIALIFLVAVTVVYGCNNKEHDAKATAAIPAKPQDTLPYYDVAKEILKEVAAINQMEAPFIYRVTVQQGKKDSVLLNKNEFTRLAAPFYQLQLNNPDIKKEYKESVFADNDTKSYVLDYKTTNEKLPVKSVAVMLDNQQQDFKRADLLKSYRRNDTLFEERLAWITGKKFQVIQIATAGGTELTKQTYVYWRESE